MIGECIVGWGFAQQKQIEPPPAEVKKGFQHDVTWA